MFIFLSDPHLVKDLPVARRDEDIMATWNGKFRYILEYAKNQGSTLLIAGDLFDTPRNWTVMARLSRLLKEYFMVPIFVVGGQHDTYLYNEETRESTALGELDASGLVTLLNSKGIEHKGHVLYGASYGQEVPVPVDGPSNILVIHKMIVDTALWKGQDGAVSCQGFLKQHPGYRIIHCGDAHQRFIFTTNMGRAIVNSGPLLRLEGSAEMFSHKPGVFVYDGKKIKWEVVPHLPAADVLTRDHIERKSDISEKLDAFIATIKSGTGGGGLSINYYDNLIAFMDNNNINGEVRERVSRTIGREL